MLEVGWRIRGCAAAVRRVNNASTGRVLMATSIVQSWRALDPRRLWQVWNNVRLGWRLMRDRRVGWFPKLALLAAVAYVVLPFDFCLTSCP
ncbi:hypothetical protein HRbin30_02180 [bacterium HR30]|nr:hypothetical protein HRbin30_02180 [bacterium HR30]